MILSMLLMLSGGLLVDSNQNDNGFNLGFRQSDYHLEFKRIELVRYNKEFLKDMTLVTRKYNRTQPVMNSTFTLTKDIGSNLTFVIQAYKFMSNEYRHFPIRFGGHVCNGLASNMAGVKRLLECGNFTACPFVKDKVTHICNFYPDPERFPPLVPNGDYKAQIQFNYFSEEVSVVDMYGVVSRPIIMKGSFP